MKRKNTNSWIAALLTWAFGFGAFLLAGWTGVGIFVFTMFWAAWGVAWNMLRADALRPRAEWSNEPVKVRDWVV